VDRDARDLPRLAALLTQADYSLPYSLHRAYGDAALPFSGSCGPRHEAGRRADRVRARVGAGESCGRISISVAGGDGNTPSKRDVLQFIRDGFAGFRDSSEDAVMAFLRTKAGAQ